MSSHATQDSQKENTEKKNYHKSCTGAALETVKKHTEEHDLRFYGACFWSVNVYLHPTWMRFWYMESISHILCLSNISSNYLLLLTLLCFCKYSPFVQRVWIALEAKDLSYQYIEVDPYAKPKSLLDVNPRGLVPALRHGDWGCYESTVLMEYVSRHNLSDLFPLSWEYFSSVSRKTRLEDQADEKWVCSGS